MKTLLMLGALTLFSTQMTVAHEATAKGPCQGCPDCNDDCGDDCDCDHC